MKVVVIGELCEDKFVYGNVKRLSPEAPVPVFVPSHIETNRGMAGNVVENFRSFVQKDKVDLICQTNKITKTRYVDDKSNHMFIRVDEGDDNVDRFVLNGINSNLIKTANLVIISDYNKGFLSNEDIVNISKLSNSVVIDTKKVLTKEIIESVSYVKLNEVEYQNNHELVNLHPEKFIVTLGMNGAKHMGNIYPSDNPVQTMDVSGAGDTFTASFSYRYYFVNGNVSDSIIFANKMASKVVSKRGVSVP